MPHPVFHIVPKDEEVEHIAADVQPSCMQKHGCEESKVNRAWRMKWQIGWRSWQRSLRNTMYQRYRDSRVREHKCWRLRPKRYLVEKDSDVGCNKPPCHPGESSSRAWIVLKRNHALPLVMLAVS